MAICVNSACLSNNINFKNKSNSINDNERHSVDEFLSGNTELKLNSSEEIRKPNGLNVPKLSPITKGLISGGFYFGATLAMGVLLGKFINFFLMSF